ncbi:MAG: gliding motility lipoprotein GldH [Saprospiraceae bacterium]|nr:gliding motility lipoprotein GldH [Saprospiraceae bacterium]MBK8279055.1 gliding motility lipoprotein GldH [Saprospiraceae bacterium]
MIFSRMIVLAFSTVLIACDPPNYIFEKSNDYSLEKPWTVADSLEYNFQVKDTSRYYNLLLEIDHHKDYKYENLYVKFVTTFPNQSHKTDVVSLSMADESGSWYSDCRGRTCTFYLTLQEHAIFSEPGSYQIKLSPWMRMDTIPDIYRVAFKVEKAGKRQNLNK